MWVKDSLRQVTKKLNIHGNIGWIGDKGLITQNSVSAQDLLGPVGELDFLI